MDFTNFLIDQALIMVPVLYILGNIIKTLKKVDNKYIPSILLLISIGFTPLVVGGYTADNIVQAILVAGATVFSNQLIKQNKKEDK
jgi:hypothetical protein